MRVFDAGVIVVVLGLGSVVVRAQDSEIPLVFKSDGRPADWLVREWNDLAKPVSEETVWTVKDGELHSPTSRGTWLVSKREYADFVLEFEIKLTEHGNSGVALRAPLSGDPAFDGIEFQVADVRYNPEAKDTELTGGLYRALAPSKQVYRPEDWNSCRIELRGSHLKATLNGELIQDVDLDTLDKPTKRHDSTDAPPMKNRPRKGHIGFQHLSRNNEPIQIRNVRLRAL
jgi:hypothetical protein